MTQIIFILMIVNKNIFLTVDNDKHGLKKNYYNLLQFIIILLNYILCFTVHFRHTNT